MKQLFSRFLAAAPERLHFAAHSHHYWPDVTFEAQQRAWTDAARLADDKWDVVFREVLPRARDHVARTLHLSNPDTVTFGPNTHEFLMRILSCIERAPVRILSTDGEYLSFRRQAARLEEAGQATVERVPVEPFEDFPARFAAAASRGGHDLVYVSHVFYNSGYVVPDLAALVGAVTDDATLVAVDGYHGFRAIPTDFAPLERRAFYLAGGYKYAMSGEGAGILHAPPGVAPRPVDTGWFAGFGALTGDPSESPVPYAADASRFLGATLDPTGLYRFVAVMDLLEDEGLTVERVLEHVRGLQQRFLDGLGAAGHPEIDAAHLIPPPGAGERGHFLTFRTAQAGALRDALADRDVAVDHRADRLRFGFAIYHDDADVDRLLATLGEIRESGTGP